jgi:hypothetical protein
VIFIPPWHFSILKVQRGTMSMFMVAGIAVWVPIMGPVMLGDAIPGIPIPVRSIIMVDIVLNPFRARSS